MGAHPQLGVREGKSIPIPHFEFNLATGEESLDVETIIGPNPEMSLAKESLRLLKALNHCSGEITTSSVPFREF
jgi:hypothetical protein